MNLLGISGSLRADSFNTQLVRVAAEAFGEADFALADLRLPLYDGDLEDKGMPAEVTKLADQIRAADAIIISTPEYNAGLSGVLKNALDWVSRIPPMAFAGKPTAIMSAAAGRAGGARAQMTLRHCLVAFRPRIVLGPEVMVGGAMTAFEGGKLTDEMAAKLVADQMAALRAMV